MDEPYRSGYLAGSIDDCPFKKNDPLRKEWRQGYIDHQYHRAKIAELAAVVRCEEPLSNRRLF
jgi:hypothetical protein